jgi:Probable lipoprotein LpqN
MFIKAHNWRLAAGGVAVGIAGVVGFAGTTASADPAMPVPVPAPVTVTQTVTMAPAATADAMQAVAPAATAQTGTLPGTAPEAVAPGMIGAPAAVPAVPPPPPAPALVPATSGTIVDFLKDKGVKLEPQTARDFKALSITLPMPAGWTQVPDPNVPDAFVVIADREGGDGLYTSNAQVVVYKLVGDFDPTEAITHGFLDSQQQSNWQSTDASFAPLGTFPSSVIEGTFRQNDMVLNTSRRHVLATTGPDKYLVSMSVTTAANQAVAAADATDAIVNGFRVADPAAVVPPPPAPLGAPAPPGAPALPAPPAPPAPVAAPLPLG